MVYEYTKNEAGEFVCHICGQTEKNQNTMHYHLKRHEGKLPFECQHCHKEFIQASTLALHITARHNTQEAAYLTCPVCPYKTLTKANRVIHYLRKHCVDEIKSFGAAADAATAKQNQCHCCNKACNSSTSYLYHIASNGCLICPSSDKQDQLRGLLA